MILVARSVGGARAGLDLGHAGGGQAHDQNARIAPRGGPRLGPVAARHPAGQGHEGRGVQDRLGPLVGAELVKDLPP